MSNKEMLHRKQYRIAAVVAGLALAVSMTACGAQKGTEGTESVETMENVDPVVPESVVASVETTENEKNAEEFGRETLAETSVPQGAANSAEHEMVTSGTDKVPGGEAAVSQSSMPTEAAGSQTETVAGQPEAIQNQPVEYTDLQQITLNPDWEYADHSKINTGAAVLYRAPEEYGSKGIIIGVNAGHGTAGGAKVKTLCHPDGSAKTTGDSTAAGATEAAAVSGGMTFQDGTPERTVTLQMAQILRDKLLASGYDVLMLRDGEDVQLDNVARTVICNNVADCHIALHWDSGDGKNYDKGCFYISVPEVLKSMEPVASHWQQHYMEDQLVGLLGGRVAESLCLGDISTGASNDIQRATNIARKMVAVYGMSETLGTVSFDSGHDEVFIGRTMGHSRGYSEAVAAQIDQEVKSMMDGAYSRCQDLLEAHRPQLEAVAKYLLEHETMDGQEFAKVFEAQA